MFREQDEDLSRDQQIERLNEAVAKNSARRIYDTLRWGIQLMLIGLGLCAFLFGTSFVVRECSLHNERLSAAVARTEQADHERTLENQEREQRQLEAQRALQEAPRNEARQECVTACDHVGMEIQRARLVEDGESHWRPASCSCAHTSGATRILWNDLISRGTVLRRQCQEACGEAGMGMQRAIVQNNKLLACGCVNESTHRTLWDDRNPPTCELQNHDNAASCELQGWNP